LLRLRFVWLFDRNWRTVDSVVWWLWFLLFTVQVVHAAYYLFCSTPFVGSPLRIYLHTFTLSWTRLRATFTAHAPFSHHCLPAHRHRHACTHCAAFRFYCSQRSHLLRFIAVAFRWFWLSVAGSGSRYAVYLPYVYSAATLLLFLSFTTPSFFLTVRFFVWVGCCGWLRGFTHFPVVWLVRFTGTVGAVYADAWLVCDGWLVPYGWFFPLVAGSYSYGWLPSGSFG